MAILYTPLLTIETANSAGYAVSLFVLNVSNSAKSGTLQILAGDGTPLSTSGYNSVPPGVATGIDVETFPTQAEETLVYGKITVDNGDAHTVRASLVISDADGNTLVTVQAT